MRRRTHSGGFSILQLVVALSLASAALAIVLPVFQSKPFNLGADLQDMTENLQAAREFATSRSMHYRVRVAGTTSPYQYFIESLNGAAWVTERTITLRANESFTAATLGKIAEFDTRGMLVTAAPPVTFALKDTARGWTKQISVYAGGMVDHP
jgi:type II secretory pathway pseudopilin PulG